MVIVRRQTVGAGEIQMKDVNADAAETLEGRTSPSVRVLSNEQSSLSERR